MWKSLTTAGKWQGEMWNKRKNSEIYPESTIIVAIKDKHGYTNQYVSVARDMTDRYRYEEKIKYQAYHDPLTDLPNRSLFYDRLSVALSNAERGKLMLAVIYLDIDGFKPINDTLGHDGGDILLQSISRRLINHSRHGDTIARMGGDEFTFILTQITSKEEASQIAERLINTFKDPFLINGRHLSVTASIGISLYPHDGEDIQTLIKNADIAMYNAKTSGKNNYQFYV